MKLVVIGAGAMGEWFARFGKQNGWEVSIADTDVEKARRVAGEVGAKLAETNEEAVSGAEMVLVAVPIAATLDVVRSVAEHMGEDSLLMDVASAKRDIADELRGIDTKSELVSLHPLFGPGAKNVRGRIFISIPIKPGEVYRGFKRQLEDLGAEVVEMTAEEHDQVMAVTQCMTHFVLMTYVSALKSVKYAKKAEKLRTPISSKLSDLASAFLATNPDVSGELQVQNKYSSIARNAIREACRSLDVVLKAGDVKAVREMFEESRRMIGSDKTRAAYAKLYEEGED